MISRRAMLAIAALGAAASLAACGRQGELERPSPLFGNPSTPSADAVTRDQATERARADAALRADPQAPQSIVEVRDQGVATLKPQAQSNAPASAPATASTPQ